MLKSIITAGATCLIAGTLHATPVSYSDPFTSFFAFGDSLTDDGKFGMQAPPSFGGRFSNGITYAEHLAQDFIDAGKIEENFALGGATAGDINTTDYPDPTAAAPFATFGAQIATFQSLASSVPIGDNPLVSVFFGANDLFQNLFTNPTIGEDAADAVKAGIESIAALNPALDTFLVLNLPDIALTPAFAGGPAEDAAAFQSFEFNRQLISNAADLRDAGLNIIEFDVNQFFLDIIADPGALGISNTDTPCIASFQAFDPSANCAISATGEIDLALADDFLFVDPVHPNRVAQEALADQIRVALAPVPLPASLPLIALGLGAFGLMRSRRAA